MVVLCCQLMGYGVAGLCSQFLVQPARMIWPGVLSNIALLSSMHSKANAVADGWRINRINVFMVGRWRDRLCVVLVPRLDFHRSQLLQLDLLDRPQECCR